MRELQQQDDKKASQLEEYIDLLVDPSSLVFKSFRSRIKESVQQGDALLFATQGIAEDNVVLGVARARLYRPRNPLKVSYAYAPDFLLGNIGASTSAEALLKRTHEVAGNKRLVVDAFSNNDDHIYNLTQLGFKPKTTQQWNSPANLAHIIGETYQVTQFVHKIA